MNDQTRAALFEALTELGRKYPEWRLGQLVSNVAGWTDEGIWDVEDERLLEAVRSHLQEPAQRGRRATA